ncbi:MAG: glycosyltransferase family 2 protein [Candidatus Pacearchaeota archaeon]
MRKKISAVIITRNEEDKIKECIDSLYFCDEIIVIDNNSSDKTRDIAKELGAKVFILEKDDFSELRNFGLKKVLGDWILYVDADERVTSELARSIKYQVSSIKNEDVAAFTLKRKNFYYGNYEWPYIEHIVRLFKKDKLKGWRGRIHESPVINRRVEELDGFLLHYSHRDLSSMVSKTIEWSQIEAELRFNAHHPKMIWWRFPRVMLSAFYDSYIKQGGWKVGTIGIIESFYQAFSVFITYAKLWEIQEKIKSQNAKIKNKN